MATTNTNTGKYLDEVGLTLLISKIKTYINTKALDKISNIEYDTVNKKLKIFKGGSTTSFTEISVSDWVKDYFINSATLSTTTGKITFQPVAGSNIDNITIDLNDWFNPSEYQLAYGADGADGTYQKISDAETTYLKLGSSIGTDTITNIWNG